MLVCLSEGGVEGADRYKAVHDISLFEEDVPILIEVLVGVTYKWYELDISLGLTLAVLEDCRSGHDNTERLHKILCQWVMGKCPGAAPATLSNLKQKLASDSVGLRIVAMNLEENFRKAKGTQAMMPTARRPHLDSTLKVVYQSCDTEVVDGKSTLLEVQVSPNESASYQWLKDGRPLSDGVAYSGVGCDILVISLARQGTEGAYVCHISQGTEKVTSNVITLTINFPPEKQALILMYKRQDDVPPDTWPPVVNCPFINLALIKKSEMSGSDSYSYSVQGNMDDILESKEKIEYDEVFGVFGSGELVLVEGCPGGGKTTLVNKVVRDWARGGDVLNNARLVYLITLRDLVPEREGNLSDILDLFYLNRKKM